MKINPLITGLLLKSFTISTFLSHIHGQCTQEKSYPGEIVPKKLGTISPREVVTGYDFSRRNRTHQYKVTSTGEFVPTKSWVRLLLVKNIVILVIEYWVRLLLREKKTLPFSVTKSWVRVLLWKNFVIFSHKSWVRLLREKKNFDWKITKFFHRRTRTQDFETKNDPSFPQENLYPISYDYKLQSFFFSQEKW
jgi:hypothetical protein